MLYLASAALAGAAALLGGVVGRQLGACRRIGIVLDDRLARLLVVGAALSLGFAWYLTRSSQPLFQFLGLLIPCAHILAWLAVGRGRQGLAWLLLLPHMGTAAYLAAVVLLQQGGPDP